MKILYSMLFSAVFGISFVSCGVPESGTGAAGPSVAAVVPAALATDVGTDTSVSITFSEAMNAGTVTASNVYVVMGTDCSSTAIGTGAITQSGNTYSFTPTAGLGTSQQHTTCVKGSVQSASGTTLSGQYTASWTTSATPAVPGTPSVPGMGK